MADISIYQGADWEQDLIYNDISTGTAVPIELTSAVSQMRASPNGPVLASFTCTITNSDGTTVNNKVKQSLSATASRAVAITGNDFNPRTFYYDVFATRSDGIVLPPEKGKVFFYPEVTIE